MKAIVGFYVEIEVELPDDWCDRCRKMQEEMGENYIGKDWDNQEIVEYLALVRGLRGIDWLEAVGEDMSKEVYCNYLDDEVEYFTWIKE